jgi:hypothetical protein
MEVHHHSHNQGKKNWKSYFWEFLMLFLAVFCGFLAEYQLEHMIENQREKQYVESLTADLKDDTARLTEQIKRQEISVALLDSLCLFIDTPQLAKKNGDIIYYAARMGPRSAPFVNNNRTYEQLKNSGNFRLIHNTKTSNRIMDYYALFPWLRLLEENYNKEFDGYKSIAVKILDPGILRRQENKDGTITRSTDNPLLRSYDAGLLKELEFYAVQMNGSRRSMIPMLIVLRKNAEELIEYLQKQYHLSADQRTPLED